MAERSTEEGIRRLSPSPSFLAAAMHSRLRTLEEAATRTEAGQLGTLDQQSEEAMEYVHLQLETLIQTKEAMEAEVLKKKKGP